MVKAISQWFLTYPQCDATKEALRDHLATLDLIIHYLIAQEKHQDGNTHLHAYVKFTDGIKKKDLKLFDFKSYHGNYQPCRSCKAVVKYCSKEDNYISNFDLKIYLNKKGKITSDILKSKATTQALVDGDISFMQARSYQYARALLEDPYDHGTERGIWIWGPPRVGKSFIARARAKALNYRLFDKALNKWFDGYQGEEIILMDDYDRQGLFLDHYLKRWTDCYAVAGEIKGGTVQLRHKELIVTSNYSIEQLFGGDSKNSLDAVTVEAIKSRFKEVYIGSFKHRPDPVTLQRSVNQALNPEVGDNRMTFTESQVYGKKP